MSNLKNFEKTLPMGKIGNPAEIGKFVKFIIENDIKYISGSTVYFDGNLNKSFFNPMYVYKQFRTFKRLKFNLYFL